MGFNWRGKLSGQPAAVIEGATTGSEVSEQPDLRRFKKQHQWDPFLDHDKLQAIDEGLETGDAEKQQAIEQSIIDDDSPYPEVRSSVSNI